MFKSKNQSKKSKPSLETLEARQMMSATLHTMGYLPDYEIANSNPVFYEKNGAVVNDTVDWKDLKQVDYFALLPNSDGTLQSLTSSGYDPSTQLPLLVQHASSHNVPVVVTVGGGDLGKSIPAMTALVDADQTAWTEFASQIKSFCNTYGLAGVDLDWEPVSATTTEVNNYATLIDTIKKNDSGLSISADVNGDAIAITGAPNGQGYTLDAKAIGDLTAVNVMAYFETPTDATNSMSAWANYITGQPGNPDVNGATVHGSKSQLQFGLEVDSTNSPANVVENKVDTALTQGYGGLFVWTLTEDTASSSITSRIGAEITRKTTTTPTPATVSGTVKNSTGAALANVTVYLDANNNGKLDTGELHAATNSSGAYTIGSVPAGSYTVRQVLPTGDTQTSPASNAGHAITLAAGANQTGENFTDSVPAPTGTVTGSILTTSGAGVAGVTVYLDTNNNSKVDTGELHTTTNTAGAYTFNNVPVRSYVVRQVLLTGDTQASPTSNAGHSISVTAGSKLTENFVDNVPTATTVSGTVKSSTGAALANVTVFLDANNNGKLDTGELHTTTNSSGAYTFSNVPIGAYVDREVLPANQTQTSPASNAGHSFTLTKGEKLTGQNFTDTAVTTSHQLTGTIISASVSNNSTRANAFDGKLNTSFHGSSANGNWIGLDLGSAKTLTQIKFAANSSDPWNMEGGVFQASNSSDFSNAVNLYTVPNTSSPSSSSLTSVNVSGKFRYVRYLAPGGSFGDVAEIQFFGY